MVKEKKFSVKPENKNAFDKATSILKKEKLDLFAIVSNSQNSSTSAFPDTTYHRI